MKNLQFTYTKDGGQVSQRDFIELGAPSNSSYGIDISEISAEEKEDFMSDLAELKAKQKKEMEELLENYDLTHNHKRFKADNMSNVTKKVI